MTASPQLTTLTGRSQFAGFRFEREELAFFEKNVWSVRSPEQQRLATKLRTAFADLSMNPALQVDYDVDFQHAKSETLSIGCGADTGIIRAVITDSSFYGRTPYARLMQNPSEVTAFELANQGKKYGVDDEIDFETISYKLRQLLGDLRYAVGYMAATLERNEEKYLQLTFRAWDDQRVSSEPDDGSKGQFHLVVEIKYAKPAQASVQ